MNKQWIWTTLLMVSCGRVEVRSEDVDLESVRLVDLSYTYDEETLYWPTSPSRFELTELAYGATEDGYFYSAYSFCTPEHGGTHIDAPIHFAEGASTAAEIPLRQLIAKGVVIDMSERAEADPDARLDLATVRGWEERNGPVPAGAIVILRTGWGSRWPDALAYLGDDTPGDASNLHFPAYGEEAARFLVEDRRRRSLGGRYGECRLRAIPKLHRSPGCSRFGSAEPRERCECRRATGEGLLDRGPSRQDRKGLRRTHSHRGSGPVNHVRLFVRWRVLR